MTGAELSHYDWFVNYAEPAAKIVARKVQPLAALLDGKARRNFHAGVLPAVITAVVGAKEQWTDPAAVIDHAERFDPLTCDWRRLDLTPARAETLAGLARAAAEGKRR
jgi:3-methyladenine DNA glycosylase/8-oxoguanine DNA glycosylase